MKIVGKMFLFFSYLQSMVEGIFSLRASASIPLKSQTLFLELLHFRILENSQSA